MKHKWNWLQMMGAALIAILVLGVLSACGSGSTATTAEPDADTVTEAVQEPAPSDGIPQVALTVGSDGAVQVPDDVPSGIVAMTGLTDLPEGALLARLNDGVTKDQLTEALASANDDPTAALALVSLMGGSPGDDGQVIFDLKQGSTYAIVNAPEDAPPSITEFETGAPSEAVAPTADVAVDLVDFAFVMPTEIKSGPQTWQVTNKGTQWHEMAIVKLNEGATVDDLMAMIMAEGEPDGPPPFEDVAFWGLTSPGETSWANWDLPPGEYTALCFLPDLNGDFAPHAAHGMITQFTVTP